MENKSDFIAIKQNYPNNKKKNNNFYENLQESIKLKV